MVYQKYRNIGTTKMVCVEKISNCNLCGKAVLNLINRYQNTEKFVQCEPKKQNIKKGEWYLDANRKMVKADKNLSMPKWLLHKQVCDRSLALKRFQSGAIKFVKLDGKIIENQEEALGQFNARRERIGLN